MNSGAFGKSSLTNAPTLVNHTTYTIDFNGVDSVGNHAVEESVTGIYFDTQQTNLSSPSFYSSAAPYKAIVGYTQNPIGLVSGSITFTRYGSHLDPNSPHTVDLVGSELNQGSFLGELINAPNLNVGTSYNLYFKGVEEDGKIIVFLLANNNIYPIPFGYATLTYPYLWDLPYKSISDVFSSSSDTITITSDYDLSVNLIILPGKTLEIASGKKFTIHPGVYVLNLGTLKILGYQYPSTPVDTKVENNGIFLNGEEGLVQSTNGYRVFFNNYGLRSMNENANVLTWNWVAPFYLGCNCVNVNGRTNIGFATGFIGGQNLKAIRNQMEINIQTLVARAAAM